MIGTTEVPTPSVGSQGEYSVSADKIIVGPARTSAAPVLPPAPPIPGAPALGTSFDAADFDTNGANIGTFFIPPDPSGAAGPAHVVNVVNVSIQWFTKAGVMEHNEGLRDFFAPVMPTTFTFDPKVIYDQHAGRFVVVTLERVDGGVVIGPANISRILIAVSDDSDPNGSWTFHAIDSKTVIRGVDTWADYPGFAVDEEAVYITNNMFGFAAVGFGRKGVRLWIVDKGIGSGGFYDGGAAGVTVHAPFAGGGISTTTQPAHVFGAGGVASGVGTFLVAYSGLSDGTDEFVQSIQINDPVGTPTFVNQQFLNVGNIEPQRTALPDAPQLGSGVRIETNDRRALHAIWRDGNLYLTATINPISGPDAGQSTAHWFKFSTASLPALALADQGDVGAEDLGPGTHTFFPSIAVNACGDIGLGFAASGDAIFAGSYYTVHRGRALAGTVEPTGTLRVGLAPYSRTFFSGRNRWGDYTGMSVDPADDQTFWVYNEHAITTGTVTTGGENGRWGTAFGSFLAAGDGPTTAVDDANQTYSDAPLSVIAPGVSLNDLDPNGCDVLTVTSFDATSALGAAVSVASDGSYTYDPTVSATLQALSENQKMTDTFSYTITDDTGPPSSATVSIEVRGLNNAPIAMDDTATTDEDTPISIASPGVLVNDSDADTSDTISLTMSDTISAMGAAVAVAADGSFTYDPTGSPTLNTVSAGDSVVDTFSYTIGDGTHPGTLYTAASNDGALNFGFLDRASGTFSPIGSVDRGNLTSDRIQGMAFDVNTGTIYASSLGPDPRNLLRINEATGEPTDIGPLTSAVSGLAFDPNMNILYGNNEPSGQLFAIDTSTVVMTAVGAPAGGLVGGLAFDPATNTLYGVDDVATTLITINTTTGVHTAVGTLGTGITDVDSLTFCTDDSMLYGIDSGADTLLRIDPGTGAATTVGALGTPFFFVNGMAYVPNPTLTDPATVSVTVNGLNDPPTANDDGLFETDRRTPLIIAALDNDTDPDVNDTLTGAPVTTSAMGAAVSVNPDGSFSYDPTGSAALAALPKSADVLDTFDYTVVDGNGGMDTATVMVRVIEPRWLLGTAPEPGPSGLDTPLVAFETTPFGVKSLSSTGALKLSGLDIQPGTGRLFASSGGADGGRLYNFDLPSSASAMLVGNIPGNDAVPAIAFDLDGTLYGSGTDSFVADTLITIDPATGAATTIGAFGIGFMDCLSVDPISGTLYGVGGIFGDELYSIDKSTGAATFIGILTEEVTGFFAPGVISGLDFSPDGARLFASIGGLSGGITEALETRNGAPPPTPSGTVLEIDIDALIFRVVGDATRAVEGIGHFAMSDLVVLNSPPMAMDDMRATDEDTMIVEAAAGVLSNDMDIDTSDTLSVILFDAVSAEGAAVQVDSDGGFSYDPTVSMNLQALPVGAMMTDSFMYTAADDFGASDTATVSIAVAGVNDPPIALDDGGSTNEDAPVTIVAPGVLSNDSDPDTGDTISVTAFDATSAMGAAISVNPDGGYSYDPTGSAALQSLFVGSTAIDTFTYTISDPSGAVATATVSFDVAGVNDPPIALDDDRSTDEDTVVNEAAPGVLANDSDVDIPDGDMISVTAFDATSAMGAAVNVNPDGSYSYDPTVSPSLQMLFAGTLALDAFSYTITDLAGALATATVRFDVTGVNDPPVALPDFGATDEDTPLTIAAPGVLTNDFDIDTSDSIRVGKPFMIGSDSENHIFSVDLSTGGATLIGTFSPIVMASTEIECNPITERCFFQTRNGLFTIQEFNPITGQAIGPPVADGGSFNGLEFINGTLFGAFISSGGGSSPSVLAILDPDTGLQTPIGPTGVGPIAGLAFDPSTSTLFGIAGGPGPADFYTVDIVTGVATVVGSTGIKAGSLEFGPGGVLYAGGTGVDDGGDLFIIDTATGAATIVGSSGFGAITGLTIAPGGMSVTSQLGAQVNISVDGSYTYDPTVSATLQALAIRESIVDTFDYTISDDLCATDSATVSILVRGVNDAPIAIDDNKPTVIGDVEPNDTDAEAQSLLGHHFSLESNPEIGDSTNTDTSTTIPHVTINGTGDGTFDVFTFRVFNAGRRGIFDIDNETLSNTNDAFLTLRDSAGSTIATNDDSFIGDAGSSAQRDSFIEFTFPAPGIYYIEVGSCCIGGVGPGLAYKLHVSLDGHPIENTVYATDEDSMLEIPASGVLHNDVDIDTSDKLIVDSFDAVSAMGARIRVDRDGAFTYDPTRAPALQALPVGANVVDRFDYTMTDQNGAFDTASVCINVAGVNDAPVTSDDDGTTFEDQILVVPSGAGSSSGRPLLLNDSDPDSADSLTVVSVDAFSVRSAAVTLLGPDGAYQYDPTVSEELAMLPTNGAELDMFGYTVEDLAGAQTRGYVFILVLGNSATDDVGATNEDTVLVVSAPGVLGNDLVEAGQTSEVDYADATSAQGALVTVNADGRYSYDPTAAPQLQALGAGMTATDTFRYTANVGGTLRSSGIVTITVTGLNDAPSLVRIDNPIIEAGRAPGTAVGALSAQDDLGDAHTFALVAGDGDDDNAMFTIFGDQLLTKVTFAEPTGDPFSVRVEAEDQDGESVQSVLVIFVVAPGRNSAPTWRLYK